MTHLDGTSQNFQTEVLNYQGKVLVDFWAVWCGPCQMLAPVIDEIGDEQKDLKIIKIDVDAEVQLASQYNVSSIPTVIIFDHGQVKDTIIGFHQKSDYLAALDKS
jgi:thioredoxin 1